jgi:N-methylhydantoinase A
LLTDLEREGEAYLDRMEAPKPTRALRFSVEARYAGQVWQLTLPLARPHIETSDLPGIIENFHRLHEKHYSVRAPHDPVEFTEWNLLAIGRNVSASLPTRSREERSGAPKPKSSLRAYLKGAGGVVDLPVFEAASLVPDDTICGPALIQDKLTVTLIPQDATAKRTRHDSIVIDI